MKRKVLVIQGLHPEGLRLLEGRDDVVPVVLNSNDERELIAAVREVEAITVRTARITPAVIAAAPKLRIVARHGVGYDAVDVPALTARGIPLAIAPQSNMVSVAEHVMFMLLTLAKEASYYDAMTRSGDWRERWNIRGFDLAGKKLLVIGFGRTGSRVAHRARAFDMQVHACDPYIDQDLIRAAGCTPVADFRAALPKMDAVSVNTPLSDETRHMFSAAEFAAMPSHAVIVNCARGGIIDEADLLEALESGQVAGAALDVYSTEPPPESLAALLAHPRVVATPHIAASTDEAQEKVARQVTEQVILALRDEPVQTAVNGMAIRMAGQREVKPYLDLADRLGRIARQLHGGRIGRVVLRSHGDVPRRYGEVLLVSSLRGLLSGLVSGPVNLVNARVLAEETGLQADLETFHDPGSYTNVIEVLVEGPERRLSVAGTVFGSDDPRVVRIDGFSVEVRPEGSMLFYRNVDRPGMLARVGALLADGGINIAGLALGRQARGETALTAISVDDPVPDAVLARIRDLEGVADIRHVDLRDVRRAGASG